MSYLTIETADIETHIRSAALTAGTFVSKVRTLGRRTKSTRHVVEFTLGADVVPGTEALGGLSPVVRVRNSYRGECSLEFSVGISRLVCSNGLKLGSDFFTASVRHVKGPKAEAWLDVLPAVAAQAIQAALRVVAEAQRLDSLLFTQTQELNLVSQLEREAVLSKAQAERARTLALNPVREADRGATVWRAWNRLNEARRGTRAVTPASLAADERILSAMAA